MLSTVQDVYLNLVRYYIFILRNMLHDEWDVSSDNALDYI